MKKEIQKLKDAWNQIIQAHSIVLACHERPDGDALGSALAISHVLKRMGKDVVVLSVDGVTENYEFIPESEIVQTNTLRSEFDLSILIDCESAKRSGAVVNVITGAKLTACIDHHIPDEEFGSIRIVDPASSSTAEVVYELFDANNVELNKIIASQLLTGLIADTGAFRFANTTATTFRIAATLTEYGADASKIARNVYENKPLRAVALLGRALTSLQADPNGNVVWACITQKDMIELGASDADTDSIVNQVKSVKGPKAAMLFRENAPDVIRVSLRSSGDVDVNLIARVFGGGGHAAAAGCTLETTIDKAVELVVGETLKWMES